MLIGVKTFSPLRAGFNAAGAPPPRAKNSCIRSLLVGADPTLAGPHPMAANPHARAEPTSNLTTTCPRAPRIIILLVLPDHQLAFGVARRGLRKAAAC